MQPLSPVQNALSKFNKLKRVSHGKSRACVETDGQHHKFIGEWEKKESISIPAVIADQNNTPFS